MTVGHSIETLASWCNARCIRGSENPRIYQLLTDSRKLAQPVQTAFIALKSPRRNGHTFIPELYHSGVRCFVVSERLTFEDFPEASFLLVECSLDALQDIARMHRMQYAYPVVAITGSNGKTIVKEWANQMLMQDFKIVRSPKSYNSQIGVPLSVWQMSQDDALALFEAGISEPGEMSKLEQIILPDIGIFTHIGEAHAEGFSNIEAKIREKLVLFDRVSTLIYCIDHSPIHEAVVASNPPGRKRFTWGKEETANLIVTRVDTGVDFSVIHYRYNGSLHKFNLPFTDAVSMENAMHVAALMLVLGVDPDKINSRMTELNALAMRMELKEGNHHTLLINDSYNADRDALLLALDFLGQQKQYDKKTVILSDILQSGVKDAELYGSIAVALIHRGVQRIIGIGPAISAQADIFRTHGLDAEFFPATEVFIEKFHPSWFSYESVLLKGSRDFEFERIVTLLEKRQHQTVLEINLTSISNNLRQFQLRLKPETMVMAMVKAFSYGAGAYEIANLLQFHKVDWLAVAYADEGVELRKSGIRLPIMVMNAEENSYPLITAHDLQPELFSMEMADSLARFLESEGLRDYPVHLKLDTGMHRLGFAIEELSSLLQGPMRSGVFRVQSVFTHLVAAEDPAEDDFTREQARQFLEACNILREGLGYDFIRHMANTAAIRRHPDLQLDMVRLGIGLYGIEPGFKGKDKLQEVSTLRTTVAQVRKVKSGESVGYNRKGKLLRDAQIATIRIGYADGYPRSLGNGVGSVLIRGRRFPVIGNVCMDMTMVDIADDPEVRAGDDVVIFGKDLSVAELARWAGTIPYEILTGISQRVQRVYFED